MSREFRGDQVILSVKLDSGAMIRSRRRSFSTLPAGSRVRVSPGEDDPVRGLHGGWIEYVCVGP